jgi:hypothetical protein
MSLSLLFHGFRFELNESIRESPVERIPAKAVVVRVRAEYTLLDKGFELSGFEQCLICPILA